MMIGYREISSAVNMGCFANTCGVVDASTLMIMPHATMVSFIAIFSHEEEDVKHVDQLCTWSEHGVHGSCVCRSLHY